MFVKNQKLLILIWVCLLIWQKPQMIHSVCNKYGSLPQKLKLHVSFLTVVFDCLVSLSKFQNIFVMSRGGKLKISSVKCQVLNLEINLPFVGDQTRLCLWFLLLVLGVPGLSSFACLWQLINLGVPLMVCTMFARLKWLLFISLLLIGHTIHRNVCLNTSMKLEPFSMHNFNTQAGNSGYLQCIPM